MKKRFFMAVMLVMSLCGIVKADAVQTLTINGQKVEKVVSQLTFSGDNVVLHFDGSEESYPMNEVQIDFTVSTVLLTDSSTLQDLPTVRQLPFTTSPERRLPACVQQAR